MGTGKTGDSKPRLLIILNRFVIGGQAADTIPLAWHLKEEFDIVIVYGEKEKDEIEPVFLLDDFPGLRLIKMHALRRSPNPFVDAKAFFSLLNLVLKFKPHLVHTHGAKTGILGRLTAWLAGVPVIVHSFHGHFFHSYFSDFASKSIGLIERFIGKITTAVVVLSPTQKDELCNQFKIIPASKAHIIPLGFSFNKNNNPSFGREAFRDKYSVKPTEVAIGIVGRIVPIKNHSFFVKVISSLLKEIPASSVAFFIIGDGERRKQIEDELKREHLAFNYNQITQAARIVLTSWLTDVNELMNGLDIVVLTSLNEGTPLSIIEGQYYKKPVVSTAAGGVKDTMVDGVTGFITGQSDITTFCKKLRLLIESKELRSKMGEEGYAFVSQRFSKEKEVRLLKALYFSLLQQKQYSFISEAV